MCLGPGRRFVAILNPMGYGGLIAPFREARHDAAMHARPHKGAHRGLVTPHRASPEGAIGIAKDRNCEASRRKFRLARGAKGLEQEDRHISPRPDPQAGDRHEGHNQTTFSYIAASTGEFSHPLRTPHLSRRIMLRSRTWIDQQRPPVWI